MTKVSRIGNIFLGLITIALGVVLSIKAEDTLTIIIFILCIGLLISGFRELIFYLTMARHMVGGQTMLFRAIIVIDMGLFTLALTDVPTMYVMLYLIGVHLFSGGVNILRAMECRKLQSGSWKLQFVQGLINVILAVLCLIFFKSITTAVIIYSVGLVYSGVMRIITSLRKTAIVYIQ